MGYNRGKAASIFFTFAILVVILLNAKTSEGCSGGDGKNLLIYHFLGIKLSMINLIFLANFLFESKNDFNHIGIDCPNCEPGKIEDGQDACYSCLDDCGCNVKVWAGTSHKTTKCECR